MASKLYRPATEAFLDGVLSWSRDEMRAMLVADGYTFDPTHQAVANIGPNNNGVSPALTGKTNVGGVADADDTEIVAEGGGAKCNAIVITSGNRLVAYIDTGVGLPFGPGRGQVITVGWDAAGIFAL